MSIVEMARVSAGGNPPCPNCGHDEHGIGAYTQGERRNLTLLRSCGHDRCRCADRARRTDLSLRTRARHADRGRDSGEALTEIRAVLSRAKTTLEKLEEHGPREWPPRDEMPDYGNRREARFDDPDLEDMKTALREVVTRLERWQKTGRTIRSTCL